MRRGFWRLTLVLWLLGVASLLWVSGGLSMEHPTGEAQPAFEVPRRFCEPNVSDRLLGKCQVRIELTKELEQLRSDHAAREAHWRRGLRPGVLTRQWWEANGLVLGGWSALLWGVFYLASWIAAGFGR